MNTPSSRESKPRIAFLDLENSPILAFVWENYETDILWVVRDWYLLSFSVKWMDGKQETWALPDFPLYKKERHNDRDLVKKLWEVMDEAEIIIAHNGNNFDVKKANARFITHNLKPPSPFKTIDTLVEARKIAKFTSNKLDDVCRTLSIGGKIPHTGKNLWRQCVEEYNNKSAWGMMKRYNAHDVYLLEKLYEYLRPWMKTHPDLTLYGGKRNACPKCGSKNIIKRGFHVLTSRKRQRLQCLSCGGWFSGELVRLDA